MTNTFVSLTVEVLVVIVSVNGIESKSGASMSSELSCEQIKQAICAKLMTGEYQAGDRLPSIREFGKSFDTKHERVRRAILSLAKENVVELRHGSGTYIKEIPSSRSKKKQKNIIAWLADKTPNWYNVPLLDVLLHKQSDEFILTVVSKKASATRIAKAHGVLAVSPSQQELNTIRQQVCKGTPIVSISRSFYDIPIPSVVENGFHATYDLTRWLISQGHRRIAFLGREDQQNLMYYRERLYGWQAALSERGLDCGDDLIRWIKVSSKPGHNYFNAMAPVFENIDFDAMFCGMADLLAEAVRHDSINKTGLIENFAIAGMDHCEGVSGVAYAHHDFETIVDMALSRIENGVDNLSMHHIDRVPMKLSLPVTDKSARKVD